MKMELSFPKPTKELRQVVTVVHGDWPAKEEPKKGQKPKTVSHIKMIVIPDEKAKTIDAVAASGIRRVTV